METWDAITSRRNVRQFSDRSIEEDVLDRILEAGRRAPSSRNWQPWDFVVVTDRAQLRELAAAEGTAPDRSTLHVAGPDQVIGLHGVIWYEWTVDAQHDVARYL